MRRLDVSGRKSTGGIRAEGYQYQRLHASYVHLMFRAAAEFVMDAFGWPSDRRDTA
jgi:cobyrinic acid a,c-diamide synthase